MVDSIYRTRSLGVATEGLPDQYADGKAAKVWEVYVGDKNDRTQRYREFITKLLQDGHCHHILDVACGTGIDSIMLVEENFQVTSVDASDKMLKYALKERWNRRKESAFDSWVIEEANWLTLPDDLHKPDDGFDAVICLGNSFAHLPDFAGDLGNQQLAIQNFFEMIKPGGFLLIDHRNYDYILDTGQTPAKNIYYNSKHIRDIQTSILYVSGKASLVTLDYTMDMTTLESKFDRTDSAYTKKGRYSGNPIENSCKMFLGAIQSMKYMATSSHWINQMILHFTSISSKGQWQEKLNQANSVIDNCISKKISAHVVRFINPL